MDHEERMRAIKQTAEREELLERLTTTLGSVENQITAIRADLLKEAPLRGPKVDIYEFRDSQGNYVLAPLLVAKSQLLLAITELVTQRHKN